MLIFSVIFLIIFVISLFFKINFSYKIEEALFISVILIVVVLSLFGVCGVMNIGQYIIYFFAILSLIFAIYKAIKNKMNLYEIITPGLVVILLSFVIYIVISKNNIMYITDEASCYGTAAHYMHITNTISNGGSITIFSYFFTKIAGYSDYALLVSRWLFTWVCLALPLSQLKWDKWYIVCIYGILSYGIVTLIDPETQYLMDAGAGVVAGVGIAYLAVNRKKARTIVLALACSLTLLIKDNVGLILFAFTMMFLIVYYLVELKKVRWRITKRELFSLVKFIFVVSMIFIIKSFTIPANLLTFISLSNTFLQLLVGGVVLLMVFVVMWFVYLHKIFDKFLKKIKDSIHLNKAIKIIFLSIIPLILFAIFYKSIWNILYSLDIIKRRDFVYAFNQYFNKQYFGIKLLNITLLLAFSAVISALTIVNKENKYSFLGQVGSIVAMVFIYGFIIALLFIKVYYLQLKNNDMMGLERFMGSLIIMVCLWLLSVVLLAGEYWIDEKKQYIAAFAVGVVLIQCMPLPGEAMLQPITNTEMISYKYVIRPIIQDHASIINDNTHDDAKILIIAQEDSENPSDFMNTGGAVRYWLHYFTVPRPRADIISTVSKGIDGKSEQLFTYSELKLLLYEYDYVYIGNADDTFYDYYGELFDSTSFYNSRALYYCTKDESIVLNQIYPDEKP